MMYVLFDLKKLNLNIRQLISALEQTIVNLMADYSIEAVRNPEAPGVYVNSKKIASVGLRISRGCSYHGLAFNHSVNLKPFQGINTCGFEKLDVTNLECLGVNEDKKIIQEKMVHYLSGVPTSCHPPLKKLPDKRLFFIHSNNMGTIENFLTTSFLNSFGS